MEFRIITISNITLLASLAISVSACSSNTGEGAESSVSNKNVVQHTHPENQCINTVSHAHANGKAEHKHHYHTCEAMSVNSNAHLHPSSSITGFTRHVHPNGGNKHTHVR